MARFARIVVPGVPHHVTQRGVRRMQVFFSEDDYSMYTKLLARRARRHKLSIWTYCLMPNHVHLIVVPSSDQGLARPVGEAHYRYAREINRQHGWTGHLWQERFASFPMDEPHLLAAIRYVLLNPVRSGLARTATEWPHSSARAHILGEPDELVDCAPCSRRISDWDQFLNEDCSRRKETEAIRQHGHIGRPLGSASFIDELERTTQRRLRPRKTGRKPKIK
jgi:putative transposase